MPEHPALEALLLGITARSQVHLPVGVGVDVVAIAEFAALPFAEHQRFYRRVFTAAELDYCLRGALPAQYFAARFAAKEAVVKACGAQCTLTPAHIEIWRAASGAPTVRFAPEVALPVPLAVLVSLGHSATHGYAVALAYLADHDCAQDGALRPEQ